MSSLLLDGKKIAAALRAKIHTTIANNFSSPPGLAVIIVGDDPASHIYVKNKQHDCLEAGINADLYSFPASVSEATLLNLIDTLNQSKNVNGILVQLPLPATIDSKKIIEKISPDKDVDGFHPYNFGRLAQGNPLFRPCTPYGIMLLLQAYSIPLSGKNTVIIGASNIVGKPLALEFLAAKATVTVCHSHTKNLGEHVKSAEIIVTATGVMDLIKPEWLNKKQIIIDIGIHRLANGKIRGDVDFMSIKDLVAAITPVPGGVGPMTRAALLQNTLQAAHKIT